MSFFGRLIPGHAAEEQTTGAPHRTRNDEKEYPARDDPTGTGDDETEDLDALDGFDDVKSWLQNESTSLAQMACNFKKMAQIMEAENVKSSMQDAALEEKDSRIRELQKKLIEMKRNEQNNVQQVHNMEGRVELFDSIIQENKRLKAEIDSFRTAMKEYEVSIKEKDTTIVELRKSRETLLKENSSLKDTVTELEDVLKESDTTKEEMNSQLAQLTEENDDLKDEIFKYKAARDLFLGSTGASGSAPNTPRLSAASTPGTRSRTKKRKVAPSV